MAGALFDIRLGPGVVCVNWPGGVGYVKMAGGCMNL